MMFTLVLYYNSHPRTNIVALTCLLLSRAHLYTLFIKQLNRNRRKHLGNGAQNLKIQSQAPHEAVQSNVEFISLVGLVKY